MRFVPLAEIMNSAHAGYWGAEPGSGTENVRVVRNGDIDPAGTVRWGDLPRRGLSPPQVAKARLVAHDILITTSGNCGYVAYVPTTPPEETCSSNFVRVLRGNPDLVDPRYLFHWMNRQAFRAALQPFVRGTTLKNLSVAAAFRQLMLPILPLNKQRRVARALDAAEKLCAQRLSGMPLLSELRRATFLEAMLHPAKAWPTVEVADLVDESIGGIRTGPFGSQLLHREFVTQGIPVLGIDNAVTNRFLWRAERYITDVKYQSLRRYTVHPGDVLITIMGTCGRAAVVPDDIGVAINTKHLCCISLDRSRCLPEFLHAYFLEHPIARRYLNSRAKGAIMAGLNMGIIKQLPVTLPPIPFQHELVSRLQAIDKLRASAAAQRTELNALLASLQRRAFNGEL